VSHPGRARLFIFYLYSSKHEAWTKTIVSVDEHQMQQYHELGYFMHFNTSLSLSEETMTTCGLLVVCDLRLVQDNPKLRYIQIVQA
jgi:hypothetical protein